MNPLHQQIYAALSRCTVSVTALQVMVFNATRDRRERMPGAAAAAAGHGPAPAGTIPRGWHLVR